MNKLVTTTICLGLSLLLLTYVVDRNLSIDVSGAFEIPGLPTFASTAAYVALGFLTMLIGVVLGSMYRLLLARKTTSDEAVAWRSLVHKTLRTLDFQMAVIGAPVVFGLLWEGISALQTSQFVVISLQNGFAIHAIIGSIVRPTNSESRPET